VGSAFVSGCVAGVLAQPRFERGDALLKAGQTFALDLERASGDQIHSLECLFDQGLEVALEIAGWTRSDQGQDPVLHLNQKLCGISLVHLGYSLISV